MLIKPLIKGKNPINITIFDNDIFCGIIYLKRGDEMSINLEMFILSMEPGKIFDIDEIMSLFKSNTFSRGYIRVLLSRLYKEKKIDKTANGKYYIPKEGIISPMPVSKEEDVVQRYITDGDLIFGVYSGYRILNKWGLTQQYSLQKEVITNNTNSHSYSIKRLNLKLKKSKFEITESNYQIAEFFEVLKSYEDKTINENIGNVERYIANYVNTNFSKREKIETIFYLYNYESIVTRRKFSNVCVYLDDFTKTIENIYRREKNEIT